MTGKTGAQGPLTGIIVLEIAGIGPGPHAAMLLADMGATVVRVDRLGGNGWPNPVVDRGRSVYELDLRSPAGKERCLDLIDSADILIEGFRPGVMERLGLGPDVLHARNPQLIYGRMTGWGQDGPLAKAAGHDINYIALTGALAALGDDEAPPRPPLNLVGDFGGGSTFLVMGILAALVERARTGEGQVVDTAIVDGVASLMSFFAGLLPSGAISLERQKNLLGGAAPFYRCYRCADGRDISVGAIEKPFYRELLERIGAPASLLESQNDPARWAADSAVLAGIFATRSRDDWCSLLEGTDACFAPVLTLEEAADHPHNRARAQYVRREGVLYAAPAPRFSRNSGSA
ncbi:carnitine dehydratase [Tardibacter chloracetimidivorans]|uniref:Carnitine dehydratase n=1 Tax=Tardibacter chloracetimidivorans TaxID=1921510 RepID=A0A1L3ZVR8_9SPHN|nr:CaiB/BaiF CoA-transferase family protein [Tardibacter chloracetimidivorans]API59731.1 carnitine dehydratase [Tardibacter chloracetimidivorans]